MKHILRTVVCILLAAGLTLGFSACGREGDAPAELAKTQAAVGENLSTLFFDFTVNKAARVDSYESYPAPEGTQLICATVTVTNTTDAPIAMYDSDFTLAWGDGADAFAWLFDAFSEAMMPAEGTLNAGESRVYDLLYPVPADQTSFALCYTEVYQDDKGETITGSDFRVEFGV